MESKAAKLRALLKNEGLHFIMEAHNGLSAKITEEAGFQGIWASGLTIFASLGVRDNNEASWTQVLETLEFMSDAAVIPILVDGDTGYGDFNSVRRLVNKLEQRQIAGLCIEDKLFPTQCIPSGGAAYKMFNQSGWKLPGSGAWTMDWHPAYSRGRAGVI